VASCFGDPSVELAHERAKLAELLLEAGEARAAQAEAVLARAAFAVAYGREHPETQRLNSLLYAVEQRPDKEGK